MKNKQDLLFLIIGILLFCALILAIFFSISFLFSKINAALNINVGGSDKLVRIDLESLKNIQIAEEAESAIKINNATTTNDLIEENAGM